MANWQEIVVIVVLSFALGLLAGFALMLLLRDW